MRMARFARVFIQDGVVIASHEERPAHTPPAGFQRGKALVIEVSGIRSGRLYYRHANQAERWRSVEMQQTRGGNRAVIPADYTDSKYPLQYYFCDPARNRILFPGFDEDLSRTPYFVVRA
jgi:hypothetical protein